MATKTTESRNWTYIAGRAIAAGFLIGALAASYTHIVHLFNLLGTHGWQAWTAPAFIDGFALLGRLARSKNFADDTRKRGLQVQIVATSVSFIANVIAGETWGDKIFGAMVVVGYVVAELMSESMHLVATKAQQTQATRSTAATKAAATRKANAAAKAQAEADRKERARLTRAAKQAEADAFTKATLPAPVSPAPFDYDTIAYV